MAQIAPLPPESGLSAVLRVLARLVGWGFLGFLCACGLALLTIPLHIPPGEPLPPGVPEDSLTNEWLTPLILLGLSLECLGGILAGWSIALAGKTPRGRRRMFVYGLAGASACIVIEAAGYGAWLLLDGGHWRPSPALLAYPLFHGLGFATGLCYAMMLNHADAADASHVVAPRTDLPSPTAAF